MKKLKAKSLEFCVHLGRTQGAIPPSKQPKLLEQPVYVLVESKEEEVGALKQE